MGRESVWERACPYLLVEAIRERSQAEQTFA